MRESEYDRTKECYGQSLEESWDNGEEQRLFTNFVEALP
jgi:hypothetical protein